MASATDNSGQPLEQGTITFFQRHLPALQSGEYVITVEQDVGLTIRDDKNQIVDQIQERYTNTRRFAVRGKRFSLDPKEIGGLFPPPNNQGEYVAVLPHIAFTRRTLPWERSPDGTDNGVPWLALLLFYDTDPTPAIQNVQVGDLQRDVFFRNADDEANGKPKSSSTLPADAVSYADGFQTLGLTYALDYGENPHDTCQVIDVPTALFATIAPSLADLAWLAHARTVTADHKTGGTPGGTVDCSVLVGNRLPDSTSHCTVHLVSLEGMARYLPANDTYAPASITLPDGSPARAVRLVSLRNWSFTVVEPKESFAGYLEHVSSGPLQLSAVSTGDADADKVVGDAFNLGYVPLNHQTRLGDRTVTWYRGPFAPFQVPPTIVIPVPEPDAPGAVEPIGSADELVRYDPETGMFDVSYAAAWQIGRLLALQSRSFSTALNSWKRATLQKTVLAVEEEILQEQLGNALTIPVGALQTRDVPAIARMGAQVITSLLGPLLAPDDHAPPEQAPERGPA